MNKAEAIAILEEVKMFDDSMYQYSKAYLEALDVAIEALKVDAESVRHGKWISGNPICPCCGEDKFKDLDADIWADWQPKYCPNCGAKMDAERKEE